MSLALKKAQNELVQTVVFMLINSHDLFNEVAVKKWLREEADVSHTDLYYCPQRREWRMSAHVLYSI